MISNASTAPNRSRNDSKPPVTGAEGRARRIGPPATPRLRLGPGERLSLELDGQWIGVTPVRCLPWSAPAELISLRNSDDREVGLVRKLDELDADSAGALSRALASMGFVLEIERVESIEREFELRVWKVRTRQGPRTFQTALDAWPWPSPGGGHFVCDLSGDLFHVPPLDALDGASQRILWAYCG